MMTPTPMLASALRGPVQLPTGAAFDTKFAHEWALEEKLDGHRCLVQLHEGEVSAWSRPQAGHGGVALTRALPAEMREVLRTLPTGLYDGELVATSGKSWDVVRKTAHTIFVAFDILRIVDLDLTQAPYTLRRSTLLDALRMLPSKQDRVSTVTSNAPTWAQVQAIWSRGGEGAIVKRLASTYQPGVRSPDWLKVKAVHAATLQVIGFEAGKSGPYSALQLRDATGHVTTVKTPDRTTLTEIAANPDAYVGRHVVIQFQERTPTGHYRHGRFDHFAGPAEVMTVPPAGQRTR